MNEAASPSNVFVLSTGRCGSLTFSKACRHLDNFSVGHETRAKLTGRDRIDYPSGHIEIDNRLSWFLGDLQQRYGDNAYYIHLTRDRDAVANSFNKRWHHRTSIVRGYCEYICMTSPKDPLGACYDYIDAVTSNIAAFLRDKSRVMTFRMEDHATEFPVFLNWIGAEGNIQRACDEWATAHNQGA